MGKWYGISEKYKTDPYTEGALTAPIQFADHQYTGDKSTLTDRVQLSFDASDSNSIYTDSGHVYPQSLALNYIIKA